MPVVTLNLEPANQPQVRALIAQLDDYQRPLYPVESHHGADIDALSRPDVLFAVARGETRQAIACAALIVGPEYAELKRMYTLPSQRGRGVARALLAFLEERACAAGCRTFMLETGVAQFEALALYERAGYRRRGPFGGYGEDPNSVFMEKHLTVP